MSTRIEFRWPDDLVATIDGVRGEVARSAFIRDIVTKELARQGVPLWEAPKAPHDPAKDVARAVAATKKVDPLADMPEHLKESFVNIHEED